MPPFKDYREESRKNWGADQEQSLDRGQIQTGALLRISDSLEKIEHPYLTLLRDLERYRRDYRRQQQEIENLRNSNRNLKAYITRMKNESNAST